jgi:hypothetical protein
MNEYLNPGHGEKSWQMEGGLSFAGETREDANLPVMPDGIQAAGRFISQY